MSVLSLPAGFSNAQHNASSFLEQFDLYNSLVPCLEFTNTVNTSLDYSLDESFPSVTLNFKGGASMSLKPEDYLIQQGIDVSYLLMLWMYSPPSYEFFY